jgi:hypothetical protein
VAEVDAVGPGTATTAAAAEATVAAGRTEIITTMDMGRTEGTTAAGRTVGLLLTTARAGADEAHPRMRTTTTAEEEEEEASPLPNITGRAAAAATAAGWVSTEVGRPDRIGVAAAAAAAEGAVSTESGRLSKIRVAAAAAAAAEADRMRMTEVVTAGRTGAARVGPTEAAAAAAEDLHRLDGNHIPTNAPLVRGVAAAAAEAGEEEEAAEAAGQVLPTPCCPKRNAQRRFSPSSRETSISWTLST